MARVSVLLPYRDAGPTIDEALGSLRGQRAADLEILAVDDGSEDDGPARVARHAAEDPRVRPLRTRVPGIVGALGEAFAHARGPFLARMDADDVAHPDRIAEQLAALERAPRVGALGTLVEAFPSVGPGMARYVAWLNELVSPEDHARDLFVESPLCHPSVVLRREALEAVGGWRDVPWAEDYDLWLRLAAAGWELAKVPRVLLRWRHREGRATFRDPRYLPERFREARAHFLAPRLRAEPRAIAVWGAGQTGRRLARALERENVQIACFVDIDPRKIGRRARGAPIAPVDAIDRSRHFVVVAVGAAGARAIVRGRLSGLGFVEGADFVCAA